MTDFRPLTALTVDDFDTPEQFDDFKAKLARAQVSVADCMESSLALIALCDEIEAEEAITP